MRPSIALFAALGAGLSLAGTAAAQGGHAGAAPAGAPPAEHTRSEVARARYPQPVRVGDLIGRQVLEDTPQQRVLGRVVAVSRDGEGKVAILVDCCGILGIGLRRVALPVETMTVLGPFMVVRGLDGAALAARPVAAPPPETLLPGDAVIRVGLGRN